MKPTALLISLMCSLLSPLDSAQANSTDSPEPRLGTTVIGEQEAAIGLFLTPWREQQATVTDRPPRHFEPSLEPLQSESFTSNVQWHLNIQNERMLRLHR